MSVDFEDFGPELKALMASFAFRHATEVVTHLVKKALAEGLRDVTTNAASAEAIKTLVHASIVTMGEVKDCLQYDASAMQIHKQENGDDAFKCDSSCRSGKWSLTVALHEQGVQVSIKETDTHTGGTVNEMRWLLRSEGEAEALVQLIRAFSKRAFGGRGP